MELRSPLVFGAPPLAAGLACALWLALGALVIDDSTAALGARLDLLPGKLAAATEAARSNLRLDQPLLHIVQAGGATALAVRLEGIVRTPSRTAALLSFNGAPAAWMTLGETRQGATLVEVDGTAVLLDTPAGYQEAALGDAPPAAIGAGAGEPAAAASGAPR